MSKLSIIRIADPQLKRILTKNMPPHAATKYGELRDEDDAAEAWHEMRLARDQELVRQRHIIQNEIARLSHFPGEEEALNANKEELREIETKRTAIRAETNPHDSCPENFNRTILRFGVGTKFKDARMTAPLLKGEKEPEALIRVGKEITDLYGKRKSIESAQPDRGEIERRCFDSVARLITEEPSFAYILAGSRGLDHCGVEWPMRITIEGDIAREHPDGAAILAWAFRDELVARLTKAALAKHRGPGMSGAERKRKLAALDAKILDAERIEEDLLCRCKAAGLPVRRDFRFTDDSANNQRRVLAILGVEKDISEFG